MLQKKTIVPTRSTFKQLETLRITAAVKRVSTGVVEVDIEAINPAGQVCLTDEDSVVEPGGAAARFRAPSKDVVVSRVSAMDFTSDLNIRK